MSDLITIDFHGNAIIAVLVDGTPYVAMKPICENIGLQWEAQQKRISRDPVLSTCMSIMDMQVPSDTQRRPYTFLPLEVLNGWLFGVDVNRVKPEIRDKLIRYQKECHGVLYKHFFQPVQPAPASVPVAELLPAEKAARIVEADIRIASLFGTPLHIAQVEATKDALRLTGHDFTPFLLAAPAQTGIREEEEMLEPTDLAIKLGLGTRGAAVNSLLERACWQYRNDDGLWTVTAIGQAYSSRHHWKKGGKSGYNYKWRVRDVRQLLEDERRGAST